MKASISAENILDFRIIIERLSYGYNGLFINRIYNLFIMDKSYKDQIQNGSNQFRYLNDHMHSSNHQTINKSNWNYILPTFDSYIRQRSNHCSTFIQYYNLYNIFVIQ